MKCPLPAATDAADKDMKLNTTAPIPDQITYDIRGITIRLRRHAYSDISKKKYEVTGSVTS